MDTGDVAVWLQVTASSLLLFPALIGWTYLALKITVWVLKIFERGDGDEASGVTAMVRAGVEHKCGGFPVSPENRGPCPGVGYSAAVSEDDDASRGVGEEEVWNNAMKNSLWEEFYGAMGEEEIDNLSDYSPR